MAILHLDYMSIAIGHSLSVRVYLPHDHIDQAANKYINAEPMKTLYLLNGFHGNENDWLYLGEIIELFRQHNIAVIMPAGLNSFYIDNQDRGAKFGELIGKELVDVTRRMFNLSTKREDTWIAGLSMGGYGALRNGLYYNDVFSVVGAFSPTVLSEDLLKQTGGIINGFNYNRLFSQDDIDLFELASTIKDQIPEIYIACGTEDFLIEPNRAFHAHLDSLGINHTYVEGTGNHDFVYWRKHIKEFVAYATNF